MEMIKSNLFCSVWRGSVRAVLLPLCLLFVLQAHANPTGGTVTQGSATFSTSGSQFNINQSSANAFINWQSFNIGAGETVNFNQPSSSSVTFNQINDSNPSQILGNLNANGYVVLENANGFYIGGDAVLNVHGLLMTTAVTPAMNLSDGGPWSFDAPPPSAKIENYGQINVTGGGTAFLIAADIVNGGSITAPNGHIGLYDGETVLVSTSPNGEGLNAQVTLPQGSVDNEGKLTADGGSVVAQAQFVNQNGIVQANTAENVNGTIELLGGNSVTLGANSVISAQGSPQGVSAGGSVTIQAGNTFSDQAGSTISVAGGAQGGNGGQVEMSAPQMGAINTVIDGQAQDGFTGGILTLDPADIWLDTADNAPSGSDYTFIDINSFSGMSQINVQADNDIVLNTIWQLAGETAPATLSLTAGNDITLEPGSGIQAGQDWNVNLTAGTAFVPTTAQPTPASGSDGIYLDASSSQRTVGSLSEEQSYIQAQNGNINLFAANEVQVGWINGSAGPDTVNPGYSSITTVDGGNINVTTAFGDVNTGSDPGGFDYKATAPYYTVYPYLGGISTAAGGNVTLAAGGNVISYAPTGSSLPTGSLALQDGGTGAFGTQPGNVTITAGGSVYGHYVVANGVGKIVAGQNAGSATTAFALSLINGGWKVAALGDIYLQEVRNPNGDFNSTKPLLGAANSYLFTYSPQDYVDLAADGVYLIGGGPRLSNTPVTVLYPPILDIAAGAGGVTLEGDVALFPSPDQNLEIITTDGGDFSTSDSTTPYYLLMSASASSRWISSLSFGLTDIGTLQNEPDDSSPAFINVSGNMENLDLYVDKPAEITVGGNMINCSFSGQNLQASDVTSITVGGEIYYASPYAFVSLSQGIPNIPDEDLLDGMGEAWDDIFILALNPSLLTPAFTAQIEKTSNGDPSLWAQQILENAGLFLPQVGGNGLLTVSDQNFLYNPTTGQLVYNGSMNSSLLSELSQPISILRLVNGEPVINPQTGQFETVTVSWAAPSALQTLYTESQGDPQFNGNVAPPIGYAIGGPGQFDINAGSISLGNSVGIISYGDDGSIGGKIFYKNLASITPEGATVNVTVSGDLNMLSSTIASLDGGDVNITSTGGSIDLGSSELINSIGNGGLALTLGVYTTSGGNVNVTALGDVDIDGSRIATYDGGNIFIESLTGNVDVGSGSPDGNFVNSYFTLPSGNPGAYNEEVFGSGIIAETLVPGSVYPGEIFPSDAATAPGNITVETPQGSISAASAGILQESLNGSFTPGPTVTLEAGTPNPPGDWTSKASPLYVGNVDITGSGVIGGNVNVNATGQVLGQIISRGNSNVNAAQGFSGTLLASGTANVSSSSGDVSGTIIGVSGVNVSGAGVTADLLGQNVSLNGGAAQSTLGSSAAATSATQSAAQTASSQAQQQVAADTSTGDDEKKKKKTQIHKMGRVTVILANAK